MTKILLIILFFIPYSLLSQTLAADSTKVYKKRVLESTEVDLLSSYYEQDGINGAVTGGIGTEALQDITAAIIVAIPLNDDDILTFDIDISDYTSASTSKIDPFINGTGASHADIRSGFIASYSHSSDDRNNNWSGHFSLSSEFDYFSFGLGGSFSKSIFETNTNITINANIFLDEWELIYPRELRPFEAGGLGLDDPFFTEHTITGNTDYSPVFNGLNERKRNTYSLGLALSQILSSRMQTLLSLDIVQQNGLLSTPFHRVYFKDVEASFINDFHLANDVEKLPDTRVKVAVACRLNYYLNEVFVIRSFYRFYSDDWGIQSHTASIEVPIKIANRWTLYPSYRLYFQEAAMFFAPYNEHDSKSEFYTSDFDISKYKAGQFGFGISYTDVFTGFNILRFGLKSIDLKYANYQRSTGLNAGIITGGLKFVMD